MRVTIDIGIRLLLDLGADPYPGDEVAKEAIRRHLENETIFWPVGDYFGVVDAAEITDWSVS